MFCTFIIVRRYASQHASLTAARQPALCKWNRRSCGQCVQACRHGSRRTHGGARLNDITSWSDHCIGWWCHLNIHCRTADTWLVHHDAALLLLPLLQHPHTLLMTRYIQNINISLSILIYRSVLYYRKNIDFFHILIIIILIYRDILSQTFIFFQHSKCW